MYVLFSTKFQCTHGVFYHLPVQVNSGAHLLRDVRHDLSDVVEICEGRKKQTNYLRSLVSDLAKGQLYMRW